MGGIWHGDCALLNAVKKTPRAKSPEVFMATETDLLYLVLLIVLTLILHVALSLKGPHKPNGNGHA